MNSRGQRSSLGSQPPAASASRQLSSGAPAAAANTRNTVVAGGGVRTVQALHPMSERGAAIRQDMESMMSDYFDGPSHARRGGGSSPPPSSAMPIRTAGASSSSMCKFPTMYTQVPQSFYAGPKSPEGRQFTASDRNLLCMDVLGTQCVVGSADHGLRVFDISTLREKRNLYNKKFGHSEWVTTCAYLRDGRILSGGMDSKLCLWHASAVRCDDLLGHTGSISQVEVNDQGMAISAAYDRTLRLWDCNRKTSTATLSGHTNPVMSFAWNGTLLLSGDRRGGVKFWDLDTTQCVGNYDAKGQVGALGHIVSETMGHLSFVGDQSGTLTVFDIRRTGTQPVFREVLHPGGVVSLAEGLPAIDKIVTVGADRRMLCLDTRMDLAVVHEWNDHKDFVYSLKTFGSLVISGAGNGWLLVHDAVSGQCQYGLGANKAAVRCIFASPEFLVCAGDDGSATVYDY